MFTNSKGVFCIECAELISLTFLISLISSYIPNSLGGNGFAGTAIRSIALVLIGVIANNYFLSMIYRTVIFSWAVTALQCFLSGTAITLTPAMMIGGLLKLESDNAFVAFLVKKLPQTKIGQALSKAVSDSLVMVGAVLLLESQFGSVTALVSQTPVLLSIIGIIVLELMGIRLLIKSIAA